jgi:hypothetical protein
MDVDSRWYKHSPLPVMSNDKGKILWDFPVQTDRAISANRQDIIIENKVDKSGLLVDASVPHDGNVVQKHHEKNLRNPAISRLK